MKISAVLIPFLFVLFLISCSDSGSESVAEGTLEFSVDTISADTIDADSLAADTISADTIDADTLAADTISADTIDADTLAADTVPADTIVADTLAADTVPADTIVADTLPVIDESAFTENIPLDSSADFVMFKPAKGFSLIRHADEILSWVNAKHGKIVFREELTEKLIYWNLDNDSLYSIENDIDAYHPAFSPDGKWIAFSTTFEGKEGISNLYVQNLESGEIVRLNVISATVPRWRALSNGDTVIFYVDDAEPTQHESWKQRNTWMVRFSDGKFGTPQLITEGAFTTVSDDFLFANAGGANFINRRISFADGGITIKDSLWYNGEQVCNLSMAKDGSLRTAFLDMTGTLGEECVGGTYSPHEYIFVMDSTGKIIQSVRAPEDFVFDCTEWLTGERMIASLADMNHDQFRNRIAYVNMENGAVYAILLGGDMIHPDFWFE